MYKNAKPIILNCFSRGGSNILWNMFLSHPGVCSPVQETLQIFSINIRSPRLEGLKTVLLSKQLYLFNQWYFEERKVVADNVKRYIDNTLYNWKLNTINDGEMIFKYEDQKYNVEEIKNTRLVIKNNNGLIYLSKLFFELYPDATFIALVRHPFALYESHKRRRTKVSISPELFCDYYKTMVKKMIADASNIPNYHLVRFEDLVSDPVNSIKLIYKYSNLNFKALKKIRFKAKPFTHQDGSYGTHYNIGQHYWVNMNEIEKMIDPNVNSSQIAMISKIEKRKILLLLKKIMEQLNYSD